MFRVQLMLLLLHFALCTVRNGPIVETKKGLIQGSRSENDQYSMFLGVPYGVVDETKPFSPSTPHPGFTETFQASDDSVVCPQSSQGVIRGHIQCLHLHIYVPDAASSENRLPVLVWVHGGAFVSGDGNRRMSSPTFLIRHDVIVIGIHYRVGVYGFMCTDSAKSPGNNGLKDQMLALRWINENIEAFGGDSNKITLMGESAGGMSVHLHLLSNHEKLYSKAIIQSGSSSSPWTVVETNNTVPFIISEALGFVTDDLDDAIDFIASADVHDVTAESAKIRISHNEPVTKPCVEKQFEGIENFVPVHPNVARSTKVKTIPVLIGYNSQEMLFKYGNSDAEFFDNYSFKDLLEFGFNVTNFDEMIDLIRHFYIGDKPTGMDVKEDILNFSSDLIWNHPTERAIKLFQEDEAEVIYRYIFSYEGQRNLLKTNLNTTIPGAAHADELGYLFDMENFPEEPSVEDQLIIDQMTLMWTNFVKYGDPTPETSELLPVTWLPINATDQIYLNIDKELTLCSRPFHDRIAFWNLFYELNEDKAFGFGTDT